LLTKKLMEPDRRSQDKQRLTPTNFNNEDWPELGMLPLLNSALPIFASKAESGLQSYPISNISRAGNGTAPKG